MKMVKSLLLGSAAGLVAVAGAQAADFPTKAPAKPVEYVKICSLYGAGFYYIPGTDICLKIGGYVRFQAYYNAGNTSTTGPFGGSPNFENVDLQGAPNNFVYRTRYLATLDSRAQTEWGTLRTYTVIGFQHDGPAGVQGSNPVGIYANRGFIQWAGFTLGKASSYYDIYSIPAWSYFGGGSGPWASDTGDGGVMLGAYTAQLGNGFSATLAAEDPRRSAIANASLGAFMGSVGFNAGASTNEPNNLGDFQVGNPFGVGTPTVNDYASIRWPDIVATLRVDQAWGSAQVMGALHDASGGYNTAANPTTCTIPIGANTTNASLTNSYICGRPDDNLGWAAGFGAMLNMDFIAKGDKFNFQVNWAEGAIRYVANTPPAFGNPAWMSGGIPTPATAAGTQNATPGLIPGGSLGFGIFTDGVFLNGANIENTRAWGIDAAYQHQWTPSLRTSVYGGYTKFEYNDTAAFYIMQSMNADVFGNPSKHAAVCGVTLRTAAGVAGNTRLTAGATGGTLTGTSNCDPDFSYWALGSRTQWNIKPDFYMGFDVVYARLNTGFAGVANWRAAGGLPRPTGFYRIEDQDALSFTLRAQRDFVP